MIGQLDANQMYIVLVFRTVTLTSDYSKLCTLLRIRFML